MTATLKDGRTETKRERHERLASALHRLKRERDMARAEVERLTRERDEARAGQGIGDDSVDVVASIIKRQKRRDHSNKALARAVLEHLGAVAVVDRSAHANTQAATEAMLAAQQEADHLCTLLRALVDAVSACEFCVSEPRVFDALRAALAAAKDGVR